MQQKTAYVPILMLATHNDETETIVGLEVGADDYVTSPFHWKILRARIRALLRRSTYLRSLTSGAQDVHQDETTAHEQTQVLVSGNVRIDLTGRNVMLCDQPIELSARLFDLLVYLVHHRGAVVARKDLMEQVHIDVLAGDARLVDVYVHWLREKLEDDSAHPRRLQTVRGIGYRFIG